MALTDVEICSKSLQLLGAQPIQSLDDESDRAQFCSSFYPELKEQCLSEHDWNFATTIRELNQLATDPDTEWDHRFELPSDLLLGPHSVFDDKNAKHPIQEWETINGRLHTDRGTIFIHYTQDVNENEFPPYFVQFIKYALAAELAKPVTDQTTTAEQMWQRAYGPPSDNQEGGLLGKAKRLDSQGQTSKVIQDDPITEARFN